MLNLFRCLTPKEHLTILYTILVVDTFFVGFFGWLFYHHTLPFFTLVTVD